jgi:hypothetical protein
MNAPLMTRWTRPKRRCRLANTSGGEDVSTQSGCQVGLAGHEEACTDAWADRLPVLADPSLSHIWARNGSVRPPLSICIGPLGCDLPIILSARTRSDAGWSSASVRCRCSNLSL